MHHKASAKHAENSGFQADARYELANQRYAANRAGNAIFTWLTKVKSWDTVNCEISVSQNTQ
jgi:hypothetical protein